MVDDEEEQVGPRGEVAGLGLAAGAGLADLGEPRGVGQQDGAVDVLDLDRERLAGFRRADGRLGPADDPAEQGVEERGLARRPGAEDDDVEPPGLAVGPELREVLAEPRLGRPRRGPGRRSPRPSRPGCRPRRSRLPAARPAARLGRRPSFQSRRAEAPAVTAARTLASITNPTARPGEVAAIRSCISPTETTSQAAIPRLTVVPARASQIRWFRFMPSVTARSGDARDTARRPSSFAPSRPRLGRGRSRRPILTRPGRGTKIAIGPGFARLSTRPDHATGPSSLGRSRIMSQGPESQGSPSPAGGRDVAVPDPRALARPGRRRPPLLERLPDDLRRRPRRRRLVPRPGSTPRSQPPGEVAGPSADAVDPQGLQGAGVPGRRDPGQGGRRRQEVGRWPRADQRLPQAPRSGRRAFPEPGQHPAPIRPGRQEDRRRDQGRGRPSRPPPASTGSRSVWPTSPRRSSSSRPTSRAVWPSLHRRPRAPRPGRSSAGSSCSSRASTPRPTRLREAPGHLRRRCPGLVLFRPRPRPLDPRVARRDRASGHRRPRTREGLDRPRPPRSTPPSPG